MLELIEGTSHIDHGLSPDQMAFVMETFADRNEFFLEEIELPEGLGTVSCSLYGPLMGDDPIAETEVHYIVHDKRPWASRVCRYSLHYPSRDVDTIVVIGGPNDDKPCVLYTVYGGKKGAPREPFDLLNEEELAESLKFWREHALSA